MHVLLNYYVGINCVTRIYSRTLIELLKYTLKSGKYTLFYWPIRRNTLEFIQLILTLITIVIGGFGLLIAILRYYNDKPGEKLQKKEPIDLTKKLLLMIWDYPTTGPSQASWSIKQSLILSGNLHEGIEKPSLGAAITSIDFVLDVFGEEKTKCKIDGCVSWALVHRQQGSPYLQVVDLFDPITSEISKKPDFRHTLAFAFILARTRNLLSDDEDYIELTLKMQQSDGGWPAAIGDTVSEVFTVTYAAKYLDLCCNDNRIPAPTRNHCLASRDTAILWLINSAKPTGLWSSYVLKELDCSDLATTALLLNYLAPITDTSIPEWDVCLSSVTEKMISKSLKPESWRGASPLQRFRVEARIAGAVAVLLRKRSVTPYLQNKGRIYLNGWWNEWRVFAEKLSDNEWDLMTAIFILEALHSREELHNFVITNDLIKSI